MAKTINKHLFCVPLSLDEPYRVATTRDKIFETNLIHKNYEIGFDDIRFKADFWITSSVR